MGDSSIDSNRRTMIKIAIVVCLAALAAAEADADAWYGPYGYSNSWNNNWMGYGNNWPMMSGYRQMNYMNGHEGHRFQSYGKREAEAEPEADADAEAEPKAVAEPKPEAVAEAKPEADADAY